jgi:hypothetical protein
MKFGDALSKYYDVDIFKNLADNKNNSQLEDVGWASICKICRKQVMLDTIQWSDPKNPNFSVLINGIKKELNVLTYQELHSAEIDEKTLPDILKGKEWCQHTLVHSDGTERTLLAEYDYLKKKKLDGLLLKTRQYCISFVKFVIFIIDHISYLIVVGVLFQDIQKDPLINSRNPSVKQLDIWVGLIGWLTTATFFSELFKHLFKIHRLLCLFIFLLLLISALNQKYNWLRKLDTFIK